VIGVEGEAGRSVVNRRAQWRYALQFHCGNVLWVLRFFEAADVRASAFDYRPLKGLALGKGTTIGPCNHVRGTAAKWVVTVGWR